MIKGIIFDMDGVLVDSEPLYHEFEYKFFKNLGADVSLEYFDKYVGCSLEKTLNGVCDDFDINSIPRESIFNIFTKGTELIYSDNPKLRICEGIIDWLEYFREYNYPMIVASSTFSNKVDICLERFKLKQYFIKYIGGDEVKNSKPNPEIILKSCQELNLNPCECIVIEDSEHGIKAAKEAGCIALGYLNKGLNNQDLSLADTVFDTFGKERLPMLKKFIDNIK